ncbi:hypothetical protein QWA68_004917 [Fusarium oxysporum]|nr:hypothetical protein QWA68_004917 [Fusarium oxysporum]
MIFPDPSHRVDLALIYNHVLSEIRTPITSQEEEQDASGPHAHQRNHIQPQLSTCRISGCGTNPAASLASGKYCDVKVTEDFC